MTCHDFNDKKEKYCYLTPDFPKEAFTIVLLFNVTKAPLMLTPLSTVIKNINEADKCIGDLIIGSAIRICLKNKSLGILRGIYFQYL